MQIKVIEYNRKDAVSYSNKWAMGRNPAFYDFSELGGDCANFVSQCLYAGSGVMNYTKIYGWYYININNRAPAWSGTVYLYNFLVSNKTRAVFGQETSIENIEIGDVIQLGDKNNNFYHSLFVVQTGEIPSYSNILINTHTYDSFHRPLNSYEFYQARFIKIKGVYLS